MRPEKNGESQNVRNIRIEHKPKSQILTEESNSWAVSYADMLMVLMSFFVLFFSMEKNSNNQPTDNGKVPAPEDSKTRDDLNPPGSITQAPGQGVSENTVLKDIRSNLAQIHVPVESSQDADEITLRLPDNLYEVRQFALNSAAQKQFDAIFSILKNHQQNLRLKIIGHTDSIPVKDRNPYLESNMDLSALRASRALAYAIEQGFDRRFISIEAFAENERNARTLSLKISTRPPTP